jgi:hypothetical protein
MLLQRTWTQAKNFLIVSLLELRYGLEDSESEPEYPWNHRNDEISNGIRIVHKKVCFP